MRKQTKILILVAGLLIWLAGCAFPVRLVLEPSENPRLDEPLIEITLLPEQSSPAGDAGAQPEPGAELVPPEASLEPAQPKGDVFSATLPVTATSMSFPAAQPAWKPLFAPQSGTPVAAANFVQPQAACAYLGVAGQIFYPDGTPATGLIVEVTGLLSGKSMLKLALSGNSPVLGAGGYELQLASAPAASQKTLTIQLFDLKSTPLSEKIPFDTYSGADACSRNLILINFAALPSGTAYEYIFPLMYQAAPAR
jgi:hypothetical protein